MLQREEARLETERQRGDREEEGGKAQVVKVLLAVYFFGGGVMVLTACDCNLYLDACQLS